MKGRKNVNSIEISAKKKIMSVIFIPHTERSELAKRWREFRSLGENWYNKTQSGGKNRQ